MTKNTLGKNLKNARIEKGLTQQELAERLHVDRSLISKFESEKVLPNDYLLQSICEEIQLNFEDYKIIAKDDYNKKCVCLKIVTIIILVVSLLMILCLCLPYLKYPDYLLPRGSVRQIVFVSPLTIATRLHNPFPLLSIILASFFIAYLFSLLIGNKRNSNYTYLAIGLCSLIVVSLFVVSMVIAVKDYYSFYYYPYCNFVIQIIHT